MQRVLILGSPGAGKTTLARLLGEATGLPVVHLDQLYWRAGWIEAAKDVWSSQVRQALSQRTWIMDGNYGATLPLRLESADTAIFLDVPTWLCLVRVLRRTVTGWRRERPDMATGCPERFDWVFLVYTATFRARKRQGILDQLSRFPGTVLRLTSLAEVQSLVQRTGRPTD